MVGNISLGQWAEENNMPYERALFRFKKDWTEEEMKQPPIPHRERRWGKRTWRNAA